MCCPADAPLHKLPDMRLLPLSLQEKVFLRCDLTSQRTLAAASSCFRPLWHKVWTVEDNKGKKRIRSACARWRDEKMDNAAIKLGDKCFNTQIVKKAIHRAPDHYGPSTLHCEVQGHLDQHQLAYVLQLQPTFLTTLGYLIGTRLLQHASWPIEADEMEGLSDSVFMSLRLSCRRQAGLSDSELERLEALFSELPECLTDFTAETPLSSVVSCRICEPMWQCSTSPAAVSAMRWVVDRERITFTAEATDLLV